MQYQQIAKLRYRKAIAMVGIALIGYKDLAEALPTPRYYAALLLGYTIHFIYCIWGN